MRGHGGGSFHSNWEIWENRGGFSEEVATHTTLKNLLRVSLEKGNNMSEVEERRAIPGSGDSEIKVMEMRNNLV